MSRKGKLSPEEKVEIVQRCMAGELGVSAAGRLAGVDKKTVQRNLGVLTPFEKHNLFLAA